jgi:hypothetical protein
VSVSFLAAPSVHDRPERLQIDEMEFVSPFPAGDYEAGGFEDVEVLGDRLTRELQPVPHRQASAELEQRLPVPIVQLVKNGPSRRRGEGLEHVTHSQMIGKRWLACQTRGSDGWTRFALRSPAWHPQLPSPLRRW